MHRIGPMFLFFDTSFRNIWLYLCYNALLYYVKEKNDFWTNWWWLFPPMGTETWTLRRKRYNFCVCLQWLRTTRNWAEASTRPRKKKTFSHAFFPPRKRFLQCCSIGLAKSSKFLSYCFRNIFQHVSFLFFCGTSRALSDHVSWFAY